MPITWSGRFQLLDQIGLGIRRGRSDLVMTLARLADVQMLAVAKIQGSSSMAPFRTTVL
jgi:hypothetical protein